MTFETGSYYDNVAILSAALATLKAGAAEEALRMLVELRRAILKGTDVKSKVWLILDIDRAIPLAHASCRGSHRQPLEQPRDPTTPQFATKRRRPTRIDI